MKVVQINQVSGYGSTGKIVEWISDVLNENNIENAIIYSYYNTVNENAIKIGTKKDHIEHKILSRITGKHGLYSTCSTRQIIDFLEKYAPNVIHIHNMHGFYLNYEELFLYIKEKNIPIIMTLHDCWTFTGHCAHFDYIKCEKWKSGCFKCPQLYEYPKALVDNSRNNWKIKQKNFSGIVNCSIVTPSYWLSDMISNSFLGTYKRYVIPNGIDLTIFNIREDKITDKKIVLASVPTLKENDRKGGGFLRRLIELLDEDYELWIIGYKDREKNIPERIKILPYINDSVELAKIYSKASVFANCTLEDTFPTVNLEALACGTPVVTFDTGGSKEMIDDSCGAYVEQGNIVEMVLQINKWAALDCRYECRSRAQKYEYHDKFYGYLKLYQSMVG